MKSTLHEILFESINTLCCGPDAAQAGTANSPWPRSSGAACFKRAVKRVLTFKQAPKSRWFHCCLNPGDSSAARRTSSTFLLPDFLPWVRAGPVAGEAMGRCGLGLTLFISGVSVPWRSPLGSEEVLGLWVMPAKLLAGGGRDVIPLGCSVPFLPREETLN